MRCRSFALVALATVALAAPTGCNSITGVDGLTLSAQGAAGPTATGGGAGGAATGPATTSTTSATGPTTTSTTSGPPPPTVAAQGVAITEIALYQGPKRGLFGGQPTPIKVPIVAGRDALLRIFVTPSPSYGGAPITARLTLSSSPAPLEVTAPVTLGAEETLGSTLNFHLPGALLASDTSYRVDLVQAPTPGAVDNPSASLPPTGFAPLDVAADGDVFRVVIVPVQYDADGSHRLPDTSPEKIQGYRDALLGTYPIRALDLSVHAPFPYAGTVFEFGLGWGALQDAIAQLREDEGAAPDVYYFGIFAPAPSFDDYCIGSCTTGLGVIGTAENPKTHAAIGLGFPGPDGVGTLLHELGHSHGRRHAPCGGASGVDLGFPYPFASAGVWGFDVVKKALMSPDVAKDMMGYCDPYWISDYTYAGIFERMRVVSGAQTMEGEAPAPAPVAWEKARLEFDGAFVRLPRQVMRTTPGGRSAPVTVARGGATEIVAGQWLPYDHLPGGVLYWPASPGATAVSVLLDGVVHPLTPGPP